MLTKRSRFNIDSVLPRSSKLIWGETEEDLFEDVVELPIVQAAHQVQVHLGKLSDLEFAHNTSSKQLGLVRLQSAACRRDKTNPSCLTREPFAPKLDWMRYTGRLVLLVAHKRGTGTHRQRLTSRAF